MVPVYISWGPCQHSKSMKRCSWLAPLNSVAYIKENLTCFLMAGDGYFLLQILSTLLGTVWPKWKNSKNLKPTTLRHPDAWISFFSLSLFFKSLGRLYEVFTNWFLPLVGQSFHHLCTETTASMLECPIAGKCATHFKARCLPKNATLQSKMFCHSFSFPHCSAKALVPKLLATRDFDQPQNLTASGLRLSHTLIKAAWSSLTAICESTLVKSLPVLAQMLSSNPGSHSQTSETCIPKMH